MTSIDLLRLICALIPPLVVTFELVVFMIQSSQHKKQAQSNSCSPKYESKTEQQPYSRIEKLAIVTFICNIVFAICILLWYFYEFTSSFNLNKIIAIIYAIFLGLSTLTAVLFYLHRFHISFVDTAFEPTSKFIKTYIFVAIAAFLFIVIGLYLRITNSVDDEGNHKLRIFGSLLLSIAWMADVSLFILLAYLFAKKLFLLVLMQQQSAITSPHTSIEIASVGSSSVESLSENQLHLIDEIAKQTTLIIVGTFCGIIIPLAIVLAAMFSNNEYVFAIYFVSRGVVLILCSTVLWLSFAFASKQYDFCCGRIHKLNYSCCIKCAKRLSTNQSK